MSMQGRELKGLQLIAAARVAFVTREGFDVSSWEDKMSQGEMALAAACCAAVPHRIYLAEHDGDEFRFVDPWPFDEEVRAYLGRELSAFYEPTAEIAVRKRIDALVLAGSFIAAEIDRLLRIDQAPADHMAASLDSSVVM